MNNRKVTVWYVATAMAFAFCIVSLFAQTNGVPPIDGDPIPKSTSEFWTFAIAGITPIIVWGVSKIPNLPKAILPSITPVVGILLGVALNKLDASNLSWVDMGKAGALAVFIREVFNQWVTKQLDGTAQKTGPQNK